MLAPDVAQAASLDGAALQWPWALPFLGILLTIATGPLLFPKIWHRYYSAIALLWSLLTLGPLALFYGVPAAVSGLSHAMLGEYLSFIVLLFALYTVAGGVLVTGNLRGNPLTNTVILGIGTLMASVVGTTGAAMILIRPLIRANATRAYNVHVVVFFIFLVANIGGALSPLGDPPLFVGFLRGVEFFWTTTHLLIQTALVAAVVLMIFVVLDLWLYRKDRLVQPVDQPPLNLEIKGRVNLLLLGAIILAILLSATFKSGIVFDAYGTPLALQNLLRDGALIVIAFLSLWLTPNEHREANGFTWEPIREVAILFAGIFICIIPVLAVLAAGEKGVFAWLLALVTSPNGLPNNVAYFWLTGGLSAFLDNAPTYLVFFELAGGNAPTLMGLLASTLGAISMGAVYMGALTYIGNAPNFIVYAIAVERGVKMPSFFGYMLWSGAVLLPVFALLHYLFIR
jgi:Na+/H+ antiporter NhaD/arsenite permease-like protein